MYIRSPATIIAIAVLLPVLDIIAVAMRFITRRVQRLQLQTDDWLTLPALVCAVLNPTAPID